MQVLNQNAKNKMVHHIIQLKDIRETNALFDQIVAELEITD